LKKDRKVEIVEELKGIFTSSDTMVVADYRGLDVEEINSFRNDCRQDGILFRVVKNTLARRALTETSFAEIEDLFDGPTAVAVVQGDPVSLVKAMAGFAKEKESFEIKGGVLDGGRVSAEDIRRIATLPSREELLSKMVGSLNNPLSGLVVTLSGIVRSLFGALEAIRQSKESG
jgi:large subunit ribosomal protein L10